MCFHRMSQTTEVWKFNAVAVTMPDLTSEWDKEKLRNWMANAKRLGRSDVYQAAFRQLCRSAKGGASAVAVAFARMTDQ
jgi:hypothetical protein